jgi:hypothetical protein
VPGARQTTLPAAAEATADWTAATLGSVTEQGRMFRRCAPGTGVTGVGALPLFCCWADLMVNLAVFALLV